MTISDDLHYLTSIYRHLKDLALTVKDHSLGVEILYDNLDWLDCYITRLRRDAMIAESESVSTSD